MFGVFFSNTIRRTRYNYTAHKNRDSTNEHNINSFEPTKHLNTFILERDDVLSKYRLSHLKLLLVT